jgi:nucleoside-diphosphate-sugar epimerase
MKILITGGSGFVGRNLIKALNKDYDVYSPTSNELDLTDAQQVTTYLQNKYFDVVIHCAIRGGRRLQPDTADDMYENLSMYFHLMDNRDRFGKFFNFASGAEFDRRKGVFPTSKTNKLETSWPIDYYGMSKNIISRLLKTDKQSYNFRIYGVFGTDEDDTRFIKASLLKIKQNLPIEIHQDKLMDFIHIDDLINIIKYYLSNPKYPLDSEVELVYSQKYTLSRLATLIKEITESQVSININSETKGGSYIGSGIGVDDIVMFNVKGLKAGIKKVWDEL